MLRNKSSETFQLFTAIALIIFLGITWLIFTTAAGGSWVQSNHLNEREPHSVNLFISTVGNLKIITVYRPHMTMTFNHQYFVTDS